MTKYTDKQIIEAIKKAGGKKHPGTVYAWELSMYKEVLDALPEPDSEWEQVNEISQLRRGDMLKVVADNVTRIYRYAVKKVDKRDVIFDNGTVVLIDFTHNDIYRIPAPVQHPDPKEQLVILVRGAYNVEWSNTYAFVSDGSGYCIVEPTSDSRLLPESITNWEPADIVPKVVEDDR